MSPGKYYLHFKYWLWTIENYELPSTTEKPKKVVKKKTTSKKPRKSKKEKEVTPEKESNRTFPDYLVGNEGTIASQRDATKESSDVLPSVKKMMQTKKDKQKEMMSKMKQHLE